MRSEACLPDNFGSFVFAPVVNIFFDFMRLKFVFICWEKAYLAPDWGASGVTLLVANAVNATLPQTQRNGNWYTIFDSTCKKNLQN